MGGVTAVGCWGVGMLMLGWVARVTGNHSRKWASTRGLHAEEQIVGFL